MEILAGPVGSQYVGIGTPLALTAFQTELPRIGCGEGLSEMLGKESPIVSIP
jgi:hypothetical protein